MKLLTGLFLILSIVLVGCTPSLSGGTVTVTVNDTELVENLGDVVEEVLDTVVEEVEEIVEEVVIEEPTGPISEQHLVMITDDGFEPEELTINVGDTVTWENVRSKSPTKAIVIGVHSCNDVKSKIYDTGNSYSFTFQETNEECTVVDGVYETMAPMTVVVQ
jgi:plastocyanin